MRSPLYAELAAPLECERRRGRSDGVAFWRKGDQVTAATRRCAQELSSGPHQALWLSGRRPDTLGALYTNCNIHFLIRFLR